MKMPGILDVVAQYARAQLYAIGSIKSLTDLHLAWGPVYARKSLGIGARNFSLYSLADAPRHTWFDYLANQPLKDRYATFTTKEARVVADDKIAFYEHCREHGIATANIVALITSLPRPANSTIAHLYSSQALAKALVPGAYFVKPSNGSHGEGTFSLTVGASDVQWMGKRGTFDEFLAYCTTALSPGGSLIVQPKLVNHDDIRNITQAKGLSTIRVVTFRQRDGIKAAAACLRIVVGDSEIDSFSHGTSGNLLAAVDMDSGRLLSARGSRSRAWPKMTDVPNHPISGKAIVGVQLPHWDDVIDLVSRAHQSIKGLQTVGWDVAITPGGPLVVEANWRYDIDLLQVAYKRGFRQLIDENLALNH